MNLRILDWLACPACGDDLTLRDARDPGAGPGDRAKDEGTLGCGSGHEFRIEGGVPRLDREHRSGSSDDATSIRESFTREWEYFDYERDRTWGTSVEDRRAEFLRHVDLTPADVEGKVVLDAGCGNGTLSQAISDLGCEVLAADLSRQVGHAHRHFAARGTGRTHYIQSDLMHPPFRPDTFDVIFCAGVLHHTPDTRATFERLVPALAPGGTIFVWLYHHVPGRVLGLKARLRTRLSRLPASARSGLVLVALLPQAMVRQHVRTLLRRNAPNDRLRWRERMVVLLDSYTPRYRWEHTPSELSGWYEDHGFVDVHVTEMGEWGFGVVARRPVGDAAVHAGEPAALHA